MTGAQKMKLDVDEFRVREGDAVRLREWPTTVTPVYRSRTQYQALLRDRVDRMSALQQLHYASNQYAVLVIFQGMDASGKDGAIRHVMSGVNPAGCEVFSFKQPTAAEQEHDFLWRTTARLPERGRIGIFNRSYYEDVIVPRVHPDLLRRDPVTNGEADEKTLWRHRYRSILDLEKHLHENATRIVKLFLHVSKQEQRKRLLERIDDPGKNWKLSVADIEERSLWKQYRKAYESCLTATTTRHAPWHVIPADDKDTARLIVSQIILDTLEGLETTYAKPGSARRTELKTMRRRLEEDR